MSFLQILQPQAGTNLIANPSFETGTTGWSAILASISAWPTWQMRGLWSLRVKPSPDPSDGVYYSVTVANTDTYTFSVYGLFVAGESYQIRIANSSGTTIGSALNFTGTGVDQRVSVTASVIAQPVRLYVQKVGNFSGNAYYIDAAQLETGNAATTYIDGDQDGCTWTATPHASASIRSAQYSSGGKWLDWTDDLGLDLIDIQGLGMPPTENVAVPYALLPGAQFQRSIPRSRVITIIGLARGSTWANLHQLRNVLIGRVNADVVSPQQPITLRYTGAGGTVTVQAYYDSGLEIAQTIGFNEQFALRMVAHDPYVYAEDDDAVQLSVDSVTTSLAHLDMDGTWQFPISFTGEIYAIAPLSDGTWVVGGDFTNAGGIAACDYIAQYDPAKGTFGAFGTGTNGIVRSIVIIDPDQPAFVAGGDFTLAGGVANTVRVARYRASTGWSAYGTGANNTVRALTLNSSGGLIAAGDFTTINGVAANRIAVWNGTTWVAYGTGLNGAGRALLWYNETLYVAGSFTTANGVTVNRVAYWDPSVSTFRAMAGGVNNTVYALVGTTSGVIYAGGAFTTAGGATALRVAAWNGSSWTALSSGVDSQVNALALTPEDQLIVASEGTIIAPFGTSVYGAVAIWDGSTWAPFYHTDVDTTGGAVSGPQAIASRPDGAVCVGMRNPGCAIQYGVPVTITNTGTAPASPIVINGAYGLYNWTTGRAYYLRLPAALVDTRQGQQRIVNGSGIASPGLFLRGQLAITLQAGANTISLIAWDSTTGYAYWRRRNLSADGV